MIPLVNPEEHHRELFSGTIHNHLIGTLRKLLRIIASRSLEVRLMDLPSYRALTPTKKYSFDPRQSSGYFSSQFTPLIPPILLTFAWNSMFWGKNPENTNSGKR
jgi:hypothetical protein